MGVLIILIIVAGVALDGAHAAEDNAPGSMRFPLFDVGCGVPSQADRILAGSGRECQDARDAP